MMTSSLPPPSRLVRHFAPTWRWVALLAATVTSSCAQRAGIDAPAAFDHRAGALGACKLWAPTVSGVAFTDAEATDTLAFTQAGTAAQLDAVTSIGPTLAAAIIAARPYGPGATRLAQFDAVSGIGPTVLASLKPQTPKSGAQSPVAAAR